MDKKTILNKKRVAKASLTKLKNKTVEKLEELDASELSVRRSRFAAIGDELKGIFDNLLSECSDQEIDQLGDEREELFEVIEDMLVQLDRAKLKFETGNGKSKQSGSEQNKHAEGNEVRLPALSLPTFSGNVDEWLTFSDLFRAAVVDNQNLSPAQKLQYLKSTLKGEALKVIQSLSVTDSNFQIAWDLLRERYFHKREVLCSLVKKFFSLPALNAESHTQILNLIDSSKEFVRMMESLDLKVDKTADTLVMFIVQFKLDPTTRSWWERSLTSDVIPTLEALLQFLSNHARSLVSGMQCPKRNPSKKIALLASEVHRCPFCQANHILGKCDSFQKLSVQKRVDFVKSNDICFNCLTPFHRASSCKSKFKCRECKKSHHSLLHFNDHREIKSTHTLSANARSFTPRNALEYASSRQQPVLGQETLNPVISSCVSDCYSQNLVLLCTAVVDVQDVGGEKQKCRVLLDPGSQANFITEECFQRLGLARKRANFSVSCLGSANARTNGVSHITFFPHFPSSVSYTTSVFILNKIIGDLPQTSLSDKVVQSYKDLKLADPTFHCKGPIDILLGVEFLSILTGQKLKSEENDTIAVRSELGWIVSGRVPLLEPTSTIQVNNIQMCNLDATIQKFWEIDSLPTVKVQSKEEQRCEEHFLSTHKRNDSGKYIVRLPFSDSPTALGDSRETALQRLYSVERTLQRNPQKYEQYREFMREYLQLEHMEPVPESECRKSDVFYLPHHAVMRESSSTTKLRVVFDASAKSSSGYSLNDILMTGPRLQPDIFPILLRFRNFRVAVCADVEKMFRQVLIHPEDRDWQRVLWRERPDEPVREYRLTTVTYGMASSPYLSSRALQQLAIDEKDEFPLASEATLHHFYVDDLLSGGETPQEASELVQELQGMMSKGGFNLRKWRSSVPSVLNETSSHTPEEAEDNIKVLGLRWHPSKDVFSFEFEPVEVNKIVTKRGILSDLAQVFDPLGFLAPCVVYMKTIVQELWRENLEWDEPVPQTISDKWLSFRNELHLLKQMEIPRCVLPVQSEMLELHAFCDSSEKAYCAAVYLRCISSSEIKVSLLTAKTKVAPLKTQSLPRLELCSAVLLADLLQVTSRELQIQVSGTFAWSDSTITLAWLASEPSRWLPFVANRVAKVQSILPEVTWRHVAGTENPADLGTRGLSASQLLQSDIWLEGPRWLKQSLSFPEQPPSEIPSLPESALKEHRKSCVLTTTSALSATAAANCDIPVIPNFSSWTKTVRVVAWCYRFYKNCANPASKHSGCLTSTELSNAELTIVRAVQEQEFPEEMKLLKSSKPLPPTSKIFSLCPFLDDGIIRVGGRLKNASLPKDTKHPILLPRSNRFTALVVRNYHLLHLHAGPQLLLCLIRQRYWIPCGRDVVRRVVKSCLTCFRLTAKPAKQLMGDLPSARVTPSKAFTVTGVDFAGPFLCRERLGRGKMRFKVYIAIFVCFSTKAIHLEFVGDLTSQAFIAALKRFIARRGKPSRLVSDCGTNFVGADRELKKTLRSLLSATSDDSVANYSESSGIKWSFNPPSSPHFGGLWESAVKGMKFHIKRVVGEASLTIEELITLIAQVEAVLNSRPLCPLSNEPNDLSALTPGHFLVGGPLTALPEPNVEEVPMSRLKRWEYVQKLLQQFWRRWNLEYLNNLQQRSKWRTSSQDLAVGDLVLVKNELVSPLHWNLARVTDIHPGSDNRVRVVTVRCKGGLFKRPITKLCKLPIDN